MDLLIPADWFAKGEDSHTSPLVLIDNPAVTFERIIVDAGEMAGFLVVRRRRAYRNL